MPRHPLSCLGGLILFLAAVPALAAAPPAGAARFAWPDGHRAAVSLAYDDATDSQLDIAIPALDRHHFKGSFYLQLSRDPVRLRMAEWRAAAANGHELGNHTLFHQCIGALKGHEWVQPERDLATTTALQMRDQVRISNVMLTAIDGRTERTFTVPCGDVQAKDGDYVALVEEDFVAIKHGDGAVVPDMRTLDPWAVPVEAPVGVTGAQLIARVEEAAKRGTMANFTFHGVGGDYLVVSAEAHEALLAYLDAHRDIYWVAPFIEIMRYVRKEQAAVH